MKEIFYIATIDNRPWRRSPSVDSLVPFALLFAAAESARFIFNASIKLPEFQRYFLICALIVIALFATERCSKPWRAAYTTKFLQDSIYVCVISLGLFQAALAVLPVTTLTGMVNELTWSDWQIRLTAAAIMSLAGSAYVWISTSRSLAKDHARLAPRAAADHFLRFQEREKPIRLLVSVAQLTISVVVIFFLIAA